MPDRREPVNVSLPREIAMGAVPHQLPVVCRARKQDKVYLTIRFERPRWQRILGAAETCDRTFGLDAYGRRVYESCDGHRTVREIVRHFARQTHVSEPEAELAVTRFLRTLMSKGLVAMEMERAIACPK